MVDFAVHNDNLSLSRFTLIIRRKRESVRAFCLSISTLIIDVSRVKKRIHHVELDAGNWTPTEIGSIGTYRTVVGFVLLLMLPLLVVYKIRKTLCRFLKYKHRDETVRKGIMYQLSKKKSSHSENSSYSSRCLWRMNLLHPSLFERDFLSFYH